MTSKACFPDLPQSWLSVGSVATAEKWVRQAKRPRSMTLSPEWTAALLLLTGVTAPACLQCVLTALLASFSTDLVPEALAACWACLPGQPGCVLPALLSPGHSYPKWPADSSFGEGDTVSKLLIPGQARP